MSDPTKRLEALSPAKRKLLERFLKEKQQAQEAQAPQRPPLLPVPRDGPLPTSYIQEDWWFIEHMRPGNPSYIVVDARNLSGRLDRAALQRSLSEIVRRHEILRSTFAAQHGQIVQLVAPPAALELPLIDLAHLPAAERAAEARRLVAEQARRPFDLTRGPLLRVTLLRLAADEHILVLAVHHMVFDAWSSAVFNRELCALYEAFVQGQPSPLPELPVQYADYAAWQRQWLHGPALDQQIDYWKRRLADLPVLELPTDRPRPTQPTFRDARRPLALPRPLLETLRAFSRAENATLSVTMLAAFALLLSRYGGQEDLAIGMPIAVRSQTELTGLIGEFTNQVVLRVDLRGDPSVRELIGRVRNIALEAYAHQEAPPLRVIGALAEQRPATGYNPLFQVMFDFVNEAIDMDARLPGLSVRRDESVGLSDFDGLDMTLFLFESADELVGFFGYNTEIFEASTVDALIGAYLRLLEQCAAAPDTRRSALGLPAALEQAARTHAQNQGLPVTVAASFNAEPLQAPLAFWLRELGLGARVSLAPYGQVLQALLDPAGPFAANPHGLHLLLARVEDWQPHSPERAAGRLPATHFAAVEQQAREVAAALRDSAARLGRPHLLLLCPPSPGVAADPDAAALVARVERALAEELHAAPGVTLIDPALLARRYPVEHIHEPQADQAGHLPYTPAFYVALATAAARAIHSLRRPPLKAIAVDADQTLWGGFSGESASPELLLDPPRLALQHLLRQQREAGVLLCLCSKNNPEDIAAAFRRYPDMPLSAQDFSATRVNWRAKSDNLRELAGEMGIGLDSLLFLDDDPLECAEVRANCPEVLTLQLPPDPADLPGFLEHVWAFDRPAPATPEDQRRAELYRQQAQREQARQRAPSFAEFLAGLELRLELAALRPEQRARAAQLTQRTNQLNTGGPRRDAAELGRLLDSGALAALGVQAADRFGDYGLVGLVLYTLADGLLSAETFLLSCRALGRGIEQRMLAHLGALAQAHACDAVALPFQPSGRNQLARALLDSTAARLGLTPAGDLFRFPAAALAALPPHTDALAPAPAVAPDTAAPARADSLLLQRIAEQRTSVDQILDAMHTGARRARPAQAGPYLAPRDPLEQQIALIWAELLDLDQVGVHDDFRRLGGSSMLAVQLIGRIGRAFQVDLPPASFFEDTSVAKLAAAVAQARGSARPGAALVPLQPSGQRRPFFCVHALDGDVLGYYPLAHALGLEQPFYGLRAQGVADDQPPLTQVEQQAARFIAELRAVQPHGPYSLGGWSFGSIVAFEIAAQLQRAGETVDRLLLIDGFAPLAGRQIAFDEAATRLALFLMALSSLWGEDLSGMREEFAWFGLTDQLDALLARLAADPLAPLVEFLVRLGALDPAQQPGFHAELRGLPASSQLARVLALLSQVHILPPSTDQRQLQRMQLLIRTNMKAAVGYTPSATFPGRIVLFQAEQEVSRELGHDNQALRAAWQRLSSQPVTIVPIPGNHYTLLADPHVASLAQRLRAELPEA